MNNVLKYILFFGLTAFPVLAAASTPDWVLEYKQYGALKTGLKNCYFGVGVSNYNQSEADDQARVNFQKMVQVWVQSESRTIRIDTGGTITHEELEQSSLVITREMMRGISVTGSYHDPDQDTYYALIRIDKDEFQRLRQEELKRAWEREKAELEATHRHEEELTTERLRHQHESARNDSIRHVQQREKKARRRVWLQNLAKSEAEFIQTIPTNHLITLRNGVIRDQTNEFMTKIGINPVSFEYFHYALTPFNIENYNLEFILKVGAQNNKIDDQELAVRFQLLPYQKSGQVFRLAVAFGITEYSHKLGNLPSTLLKMQTEWSPLLAANLCLPMVHTHLSVAGDSRRTSLGLDYLVWWDNWRDVVSLIAQLDLIYNPDWRNQYGDPLLLQGGIMFRPGMLMNAALTYENHDTFMFTVKFFFKQKPRAANR